jgi:Flp pilus assembly CpaE family ATPase
MALAEAGELLDRSRAGAVVNRFERRFHERDIVDLEAALQIPIVGVLPLDHDATQRALAKGQPVVCEPRSKLRRPLQKLAQRVHSGPVHLPQEVRRWTGSPFLGRLRAGIAGVLTLALSRTGGIVP